MIDFLERRFGRFAVPNLPVILIVGQVFLYIAIQQNPELWLKSALIPREVLQFNAEMLRLVTFLFLPPGSSPVWAFLFWYVFYFMGRGLEGYWGTFRFNLFLLIGYVATVASAFITPDVIFTNQFLQGTVFLAFAFLNPNFELRLFFIIPVQIRWLALLAWLGYGIAFVHGTWPMRIQIAASIINFFVFFGSDILRRMRSGQSVVAKQTKRFAANKPAYFHICAVCGLTDQDDPQMDFRYCSQCSGDHAYCSEHLKNHPHVTAD